MSIDRFFTNSVVIRRLRTVSGNKKTYQATATVEAHIQEASAETQQILGPTQERAWVAWMDEEAEIEIGDRAFGPDGKVYQVREKTVKTYGINKHCEVLLMEQNE